MSHAIEGIGLVKSFVKRRPLRELVRHPFRRGEPVWALRGVDLAVREGEIYGLLGPNGAGKTTLLKIFSCLVLPDAGRAVVGGVETRRENEVKRKIGLVNSDERSFYWRLTGRENLQFFARLYDVPGPRIESRIDELLRRVDLSEAAGRRFSDYSSGMKQRMAIARALLHDPPILLMDEPTRSLDPMSSMSLRAFVQEQIRRRDGKTILLASHDLREVEALADRVGFIVDGRLRRQGTVDEIRNWGMQDDTYVLVLRQGVGTLPEGLRVLSDETVGDARRVSVALRRGEELRPFLQALVDSGLELQSLQRMVPDLEEAFARILGEPPAREQDPA